MWETLDNPIKMYLLSDGKAAWLIAVRIDERHYWHGLLWNSETGFFVERGWSNLTLFERK